MEDNLMNLLHIAVNEIFFLDNNSPTYVILLTQLRYINKKNLMYYYDFAEKNKNIIDNIHRKINYKIDLYNYIKSNFDEEYYRLLPKTCDITSFIVKIDREEYDINPQVYYIFYDYSLGSYDNNHNHIIFVYLNYVKVFDKITNKFLETKTISFGISVI